MKHQAEKPVEDTDNVDERRKIVIDRYEKEAKQYDDTTYMNDEKILFHNILYYYTKNNDHKKYYNNNYNK